jgi:hypothetical protein
LCDLGQGDAILLIMAVTVFIEMVQTKACKLFNQQLPFWDKND